jgi:transcriptional regulator of nitric oxide reductase|tara:strand:+ start:32 stop:199 length:168 start_codon:yes stop_codon:yes gene_type:complete
MLSLTQQRPAIWVQLWEHSERSVALAEIAMTLTESIETNQDSIIKGGTLMSPFIN